MKQQSNTIENMNLLKEKIPSCITFQSLAFQPLNTENPIHHCKGNIVHACYTHVPAEAQTRDQ